MSVFSPDRLPKDPDQAELRKEARATLAAYKAFLDSPAFVHRVDIAVLTKIATNESMPVRERRRAAEVLGRLYLDALGKVAELTAPQAGPATAIAVAQVNQRIEIVREDDWRRLPEATDSDG